MSTPPDATFQQSLRHIEDGLARFVRECVAKLVLGAAKGSPASLAARCTWPAFGDKLRQALPQELKPDANATAAAASSSSASALRPTLELALRRALHEAVRKENAASSSSPTFGYDHEKNEVTLLMDAALWCKRELYVDPSLPLTLLEDLLSVISLRASQQLFLHLLQPRIDLFLVAKDGVRPRLLFLRLCNSMLRRLSRTSSATQAGDISKQISWVTGVDERSALNLLGKTNTANVTTIEVEEQKQSTEAAADEGEAGEAKPESSGDAATPQDDDAAKVKTEPKADAEMTDDAKATKAESDSSALYTHLWSLQSYFLDPSRLKDAFALASFQTSTSLTLDAFESNKLSEKDSLAAIRASNETTSASSSIFPKYLTGRRLLALQVRDPVFRRNLLLQLLIYLGHVLNPLGNTEIMRDIINGVQLAQTTSTTAASPSSSSSSASAPVPPPTPSASAAAVQTLSGTTLPLQALQPLRSLYTRALKLLKLTPPYAASFTDSFLTLLHRENRFWVAWKKARCPPIEKATQNTRSIHTKMDMEALVKEEKEKRAALARGEAVPVAAAPVVAAVEAPKESAAALARKRKFGAMTSSSSALAADPFALQTKSATGRLFMGTANLSSLWSPSSSVNQDLTSFLRDEERAGAQAQDVDAKFVRTLLDEESEWKKQEAWRKAEAEKAAADPAYVVRDFPGFGVEAETMLRNDAHKCWQLLRLLCATPEIKQTWIQPASTEDDEGESEGAASTQLPPLPGLDLFMRSEGSVQKLVEWWLAERKKREAAANAAANPTNTTEAEPQPVSNDTVAPVVLPSAAAAKVEANADATTSDDSEVQPRKRIKTEATESAAAPATTEEAAPAADTAPVKEELAQMDTQAQ